MISFSEYFGGLGLDRFCQKEGVAAPDDECRHECLSFIDYTAGGIKAAGLGIGLQIGTGEASLVQRRRDVADMSVVVSDSLGNERLAKGHTGLLVYRISQPKD